MATTAIRRRREVGSFGCARGLDISLLATLVLILQAAGCLAMPQPSEFLRSFLRRPEMLAKESSILQPLLKAKHESLVTVSVYVDNWSNYNLIYTAHAVAEGNLETSFPPRNLPEKSRSFGLRTLATARTAAKTGGMVGWTLSDASSGDKVSRLSIAWSVDGDKAETKFALSLGDLVPQFDQMWETRKTGRLITEMTADGRSQRITLADSHTTVTAKMSQDESRRHPEKSLKLVLTIIPQNIDVWGWAKYFKEGMDSRKKTTRPIQNVPQSTKIINKKDVVDDMPREATTKSTTTSTTTLAANRIETDPADAKHKAPPIYRKKELLYSSPNYAGLQKRNTTLRNALRHLAKNHSVAVGFHIENWTRFRLGAVRLEISAGRILEALAPEHVDPGRQSVAIIVNEGGLYGTNGVARWALGSSTDKVMSALWSVPYNRQLWRTWLAVGLSSRENLPGFDYMYSGKDPNRFVRHQAGREFEFSDGEFSIIARMDGGATFKPVVHLVILPRNDDDLAGSIRRQLGLPVIKRDDLLVVKEPPQSELVQSITAAAPGSCSLVSLFAVAVSALLSALLLN